ncbi:hypothetical protein GRO01_03620 [Gluconobacter roseus NBRC 3990]|uniref:Uncharacterized protein n=1 Tax=Gluconobacter roseus NBRC 3990 TaxID=1307950 RepID=A0A4Y3M3Z3_9PROT|nr:hypothetical protein AA3990_0911 [Gluconobacter roseus NBRC 3990]GEB02786.1 hypothetical protein GRO01_03620 [Gluconobacter roseus NBRC 3990]GLP93245.1 hypothetical protein GCM10007871_12230 [Gluconobacter roseus NBRC 3990]
MRQEGFGSAADHGFAPQHPELLGRIFPALRGGVKAPATTGSKKEGSDTHGGGMGRDGGNVKLV